MGVNDMKPMKQYRCLIVSLIFMLCVPVSFAQKTTSSSQPKTLKVALIEAAPYVFKEDNEYTGVMVDFWRHIAEKNKWSYQFYQTNNDPRDVIKALEDGKYDVALGDFPTSEKAHTKVNLSRPIIMDYASIITTPQTQSIWMNIIDSFVVLLPVLVLVFGIFFFSSIIFWWLQSRKQKDYTVSDSVFNTAVAMINGGFVDTPEGSWNRINLVAILIAGTILQSVFFAAMAQSNISAQEEQDQFHTLDDLEGKRFVVIKDSLIIPFIKRNGAQVHEIKGGEEAAMAYYVKHKNEYDGIVNMHAENVHLLKEYPNEGLLISRLNIKNELIAILINQKFQGMRKIDQVILGLQDEGQSQKICNNYIEGGGPMCQI